MANKKSSKKKNSTLFFTAVVILALLIMAVVFLINKNTILSNFKTTGFFDKVFGSTPEFVQKHEVEDDAGEPLLSEEEIIISLKSESNKEEEKVSSPKENDVPVVSSTNNEKTQESKPAVAVKEEEKTQKPAEKPAATQTPKTESAVKPEQPKKTAATTDLQLCFVFISPEGSVMRQIVKRTIPKTDSPLTTAVNLIIKGPDTSIAGEKNLTSLIPDGTKLLGAKVQDGVAYLNFSSDFERNSYGVDGYNAQLMQIVYTACAFNTVNSVQFLIEGEKLAYLSEGIWVGSPLSKNSF